MTEHDHSYKLLFSHREMVEDLLRGFVREPWVDKLDFSTLEKVNCSYITDDLKGREDDLVWRARFGDGWLYVYILLEFQSKPDKYMAVRIMTYLGLLYQDLIKAKALTPSKKLPPVLPIVLYNGETRWNASVEISELIESIPGGLSEYKPKLRYLLLEEHELVRRDSAPLRNLAAALFRLEHSPSPGDTLEVLQRLIEWLSEKEQSSLRRAFAVWFSRVLQPPNAEGQEALAIEDLEEVKSMLSERVKEWTKNWWEQGRRAGREEGREEGQTEILLFQLQSKFGPISDAVRTQVEAADKETLRKWAKKILTSNKIEDIFEN